MEAINEFERKPKIIKKYFFWLVTKHVNKNKKSFKRKSKWIPGDKNIDPDLLDCISSYTKEIHELYTVKENSNLSFITTWCLIKLIKDQ